MSVKWSQFPAGTAISGSDVVVGLQGGDNVEWTWSQGSTYVFTSVAANSRYVFGQNAEFNLFIGDGGASITTGDHNTSLGSFTLTSVTSGDYNSAIGNGALQANTTGNINNAQGGDALLSNTTGTANSAMGDSALYHNVSGSSNTAVGNISLFSNVSGNYNAAFGERAGYLVTGSYNTALGFQALQSSTSGNSNVAVGALAASVFVGQQMTAVGASALIAATGAENTGVGSSVGADITSGADNTLLGFNTGRGITTGSNNTIIGANVGSLSSGLAGSIILATGDGTIRLDWNKTTSSTWTTAGSIAGASWIGSGDVRVGAASQLYWTGKSLIGSSADGLIELYNNAGTSFGRLNFGGTSASFPALKRASASLQAKLADDTAFADFTAANLSSVGASIGWSGRALMVSPSDGVIELINNAGTDFGRIQFGGTTSSFPALGRSGTSIVLELADGTLATPITSVAAATLQLGAADAASPVLQTLKVQSVAAGTANTAGVNWRIYGSGGTGSAAGGNIEFYTAPAGGAGSSQNAFASAFAIGATQTTSYNTTVMNSSLYCNATINLSGDAAFRAAGLRIGQASDGYIGWSATADGANASDTAIMRRSAGVIELNNASLGGACALRLNQTPSAVGTGTKTISNAADGTTNFGHYFSLNLNGTTYFIPCSSVAPT